MTILHVAPFSQVGGIAYVANMIRDYGQVCSRAKWIEVDSTVDDGDRVTWGRRFMHMMRICQQIRHIVRKERGPIILHVHTASYTSFFEKTAFVLTGRAFGAKTVLHVHGGAFKQFYEDLPGSGKAIVRFFLKIPNCLLALSEEWADFFRTIASKAKVQVLENGVVLPPFDETSPDAEQGVNATSKTKSFDVLFLGRIEPEKGCWEIIEAAKLLKEAVPGRIKFHLYGEASTTKVMETFKNATSGALQNVVFHGLVTGSEKHRALREADMFILPSWAEGMPIAVLEAMAYGLPVVATRVGALPELVGDKGGILVEPRSSRQLTQAIETLYKQREARQQMGQFNRAKVKEHYSAENYIRRLYSVYQVVVGG